MQEVIICLGKAYGTELEENMDGSRSYLGTWFWYACVSFGK